VLADDHGVVRRGLELPRGAEDGFEVVASVGDVQAAIRTTRNYKPDVLVLDLDMPGGTSLEAIPKILEGSPATKIAVLTMHNEPAFARKESEPSRRRITRLRASTSARPRVAMSSNRRVARGKP
jgi:two-component system response regulator NreC